MASATLPARRAREDWGPRDPSLRPIAAPGATPLSEILFVEVLAVMRIAGMAMAVVLRYVHPPALIGYIVAGRIIGPYTPLARSSTTRMLSTSSRRWGSSFSPSSGRSPS
jgi:hypothetical protein